MIIINNKRMKLIIFDHASIPYSHGQINSLVIISQDRNHSYIRPHTGYAIA